MTKKFTTALEYAQFYGRVEAEFSPEEMTQSALAEWLRNDKLADSFALTREIALEIEEVDTIQELKRLQGETRNVIIHRKELLRRIDEKVEQIKVAERERIIAEQFVRVREFAEERKIRLSEKRLGRVEDWKGFKNKKIVIRGDNGRFITWKNK